MNGKNRSRKEWTASGIKGIQTKWFCFYWSAFIHIHAAFFWSNKTFPRYPLNPSATLFWCRVVPFPLQIIIPLQRCCYSNAHHDRQTVLKDPPWRTSGGSCFWTLGSCLFTIKIQISIPWENLSLGNITVSMRNDFKATRERTPTAPKAAFIQY